MSHNASNNNIGGIENRECDCCLQDCDRIRDKSEKALAQADKNLDNAVDSLKDTICQLKKWRKCQCIGDQLEAAAEDCERANNRIIRCVKPTMRIARRRTPRNPLLVAAARAEAQGENLVNRAFCMLEKSLCLLKQAEKCFDKAEALENAAENLNDRKPCCCR